VYSLERRVCGDRKEANRRKPAETRDYSFYRCARHDEGNRENRAVHSPVRGVHPHLFEGIQTFVKYIGADSEESGKLAQEHLGGLGIQTELLSSSVVTEIGKLLDTTYYGLCIAWHGEMKEICEQLGVNFDEAVSNFNKTYNEGYQKLGMANVVRPVLYPPEGVIGGTCVIPNAKILAEKYKSDALDLVLKYQAKKQA
jgi:hypothetical protein